MTDLNANVPPSKKPGYFPLVLLALAAVLIGLTVYISMAPEGGKSAPPEAANVDKPTLGQQVLGQARQLMAKRQYGVARELMQTYVNRFPDDTEVRRELVAACRAMGDNTQAELVTDQVLRVAPRSAWAQWSKGELVKARGGKDFMAFFRHAAQDAVDVTPEYFSKYGQALLDEGQADEAAKWLDKAQKAGVNDAATLAAIGRAAMAKKDWPLAQQRLSAAIALSPNDAWTEQLAQAQHKGGELKAAAATLDALVIRAPSGTRWMELAALRSELNQPLGAAQAYAQAAEYPEQRAAASLAAAKVYYQLGRYGLAMAQIDTAVSLLPDDKEAAALKAQIEDARFGGK